MQLSPLSAELLFATAPPAGGAGPDTSTVPFAQWLSAQTKGAPGLGPEPAPPPFSQFPLNWGFPVQVATPAEPGQQGGVVENLLAAATALLPKPATAPLTGLVEATEPAEPLRADVTSTLGETLSPQGALKPFGPGAPGLPRAVAAQLPGPEAQELEPGLGQGAEDAEAEDATVTGPAREARDELIAKPHRAAAPADPFFPQLDGAAGLDPAPELRTSPFVVWSSPGPSVVQPGSAAGSPAPGIAEPTPVDVPPPAQVWPANPVASTALPSASTLAVAPDPLPFTARVEGSTPPPVDFPNPGRSTFKPAGAPVAAPPGVVLDSNQTLAPVGVPLPHPTGPAVAKPHASSVPNPAPVSPAMFEPTAEAQPLRHHPQPAQAVDPAAPTVPASGPLPGTPFQPFAPSRVAALNTPAAPVTAQPNSTPPAGSPSPVVQAPVAVETATVFSVAPPASPPSATFRSAPVEPPRPANIPAAALAAPAAATLLAPAAQQRQVAEPLATAQAPELLVSGASLLTPAVGHGHPGSRSPGGSRPVPLWASESGSATEIRTGEPTLRSPAEPSPSLARFAEAGQPLRDGSLSDRRFADLFAATAPPMHPVRAQSAGLAPSPVSPSGAEVQSSMSGEILPVLPQVELTSVHVMAPAAGLSPSVLTQAPAVPAAVLILPSGVQVPEQEVLQQVFGQLHPRTLGGSQRMTLRLNPEELGEVRLELSIEKDTVRAHLQAQSQQVQEVLEKHLPRLREAFEQQGLKLQELQVSVDSGRDGGRSFFGQSRQQPPDFAGPATGNRPQGESGDLPAEPSAARSLHVGGVSLRI